MDFSFQGMYSFGSCYFTIVVQQKNNKPKQTVCRNISFYTIQLITNMTPYNKDVLLGTNKSVNSPWIVSAIWKTFEKYMLVCNTCTVNPLFSPPGALFISSPFVGVDLIETGGLFNLKTTMVSVLHKESRKAQVQDILGHAAEDLEQIRSSIW